MTTYIYTIATTIEAGYNDPGDAITGKWGITCNYTGPVYTDTNITLLHVLVIVLCTLCITVYFMRACGNLKEEQIEQPMVIESDSDDDWPPSYEEYIVEEESRKRKKARLNMDRK